MTHDFLEALRERVLIFDGAMGTSLHARDLSDDDYWGKEGCVDLLSLSRPDVVKDIHAAYYTAGSDVVETNTFGANAIVLAEYDLVDRSYEMNLTSARLAF